MLFAPSTRRISIEQGREIARALPPHVDKVGLFYDEAASTIEAIAEEVGLTAVQLHGEPGKKDVGKVRAFVAAARATPRWGGVDRA